MKTVFENVEDEFSCRNLLLGVYKGAGYQLVAKKEMAILSKCSLKSK
jgi:hypothetical protein